MNNYKLGGIFKVTLEESMPVNHIYIYIYYIRVVYP